MDGYTLFIKDAIIGDVVEAKVMKAKKNYGYARMMEIIHPSADRVEPKCAFARKCGGCQIQEMSYERQLAFKEQKIRGNLERIGGFDRGKIDAVMEPNWKEWMNHSATEIRHNSPLVQIKRGILLLDFMPEEPMISLPIQNVSWELSRIGRFSKLFCSI